MYFPFFGSVTLRSQFVRKNSFSFTCPQIQKNLKRRVSNFCAPTSPLRTPDSRFDSDLVTHDYLNIYRSEELALPEDTRRILENGRIQGQTGQKKRSRVSANDGSYRNGPMRILSTQKLGLEGEYQVDIGAVVPTRTTGPNCSSIANRSIAQAKLRVAASLRREDPYELLPSLLKALKDPEYLGSIRKTTLTEILRSLDPRHFIEPYRPIYRDLHPSNIDFLRHQTRQVGELFSDYLSKYRAIVQKLVASRIKWGLQEYKLLLNAARSAGDRKSASQIWRAMIEHHIKPDTISYNYYFEARCWANAHDPVERENMRVLPWHLKKRYCSIDEQSYYRWNLQLGHRVGPGGVKEEVTKMFAEMVSQGFMADVKTFGLLMTAYSREGDLGGVKGVLKSAWNVDVDIVMESDDNSRKPEDVLSDSPLYPTSDLLFTIAHIFGSNSKLAVAMRVVDHISCRFSIPIDDRTWGELLEWAYVLSSRRTKLGLLSGQQTGQLPRSSVESLWDIMVSPPYEIKPSISMIDRIVKSFCHRHMLEPMLRNMKAGLELHELSQRNYLRWLRQKQSASAKCSRRHDDLYGSSPEALQYKTQLARLEVYRDFILISRWLRLLLKGRRWYTVEDRVLKWERQELPEAIRLFWSYRPLSGISYSIATGDVELEWDNTWRKDENANGGPQRRDDVTLKPLVLGGRRARKRVGLPQGRIPRAPMMWPKIQRILGLHSHKQQRMAEPHAERKLAVLRTGCYVPA